MIYLIWFIASILVANYGAQRGNSGIGVFFLSLLLSPLIGLVLVILSKNRSEEVSLKNNITKKCKHCAEIIKYEASKCKFCGETQE